MICERRNAMRESKTPSLDFCLQPEQQNDKVKMVTNRKYRKGKLSDKDNQITRHISKRRHATLRSDGRYQVTAHITENKTKVCYGRSEYKANCQADIEEADEELREILTNPNKRYIFRYCFYRYRNFQLFYGVIEPQSVDRYENTYCRYFTGRALDKKDIRKLNGNDIAVFLNSIIDEYGRITTKEYQAIRHIIKAVIDFVYDQELDDSQDNIEPVLDWERIKRKIPKGKIYTKVNREYAVSNREKNILRNSVVQDVVYPEMFSYKLLLLINFSLGLRIGELAALTVDDVDLIRHVVYIASSFKHHYDRDEYGNKAGKCIYYEGTTKTPKGEREIPISETAQKLFDVLFLYRKEKGYTSKYLAYDGERRKDRTKTMASVLSEMCEQAGVKSFRSHIIRKSFASALSCSPEIDIATISRYLGHAQISTTLNNYIIPANDTTDAQIEKMSKYV